MSPVVAGAGCGKIRRIIQSATASRAVAACGSGYRLRGFKTVPDTRSAGVRLSVDG